MKKKSEIQIELKAKIEEQKSLIEKAETEKRDFSEEEKTRFDALNKEIADLEAELARAEQIEAAKKRNAGMEGTPVNQPKKEKRQRPFSIIRAINAARSGEMDEEMRAMHERGVDELRKIGQDAESGIVIPSNLIRGISVDGDSGTKGGELVDTTHKLVDGLFPKLTVEELGATVMTGLTGNLKLVAGKDIAFSWVNETEAGGETDATFDGPTLKPKTLRGQVLISTKLLAQTTPDVDAYVMALIRKAINKAVVSAAINGDGVKEPKGVLNYTGVNVATTATPSWDAVVELETKIEAEDATEQTLQYLMRPELKGKFKTTKKDAGSGIYVIEGKELNGYGYKASTLVPKLNSDANYPLIFGDWAQMTIGQWGGVKLLVDPYTKANSGQVAVIVELFADVQIANPKAFAINKSLTLS